MCRAEVPEDRVRIQEWLAEVECECGFAFTKRAPTERAVEREAPTESEASVSVADVGPLEAPDHVEIDSSPERLELRLRRDPLEGVKWAVLAVGVGALAAWLPGATEVPVLNAVMATLFGATSLALAYASIVCFRNRITITVTPARLVVKTGPLPEPRAVSADVASSDVLQVFLQSRRHMNSKRERGAGTSYRALAEVEGGPAIPLGYLDTALPAVFVEETIERFLGIVDDGR